MDLLTWLAQLKSQGQFAAIAGNPAAQFGVPRVREYLGATLLPERTTFQNMYKETGIRYMTVIANDGSRYSPAQKKDGGEIVGSFNVELGDQNIAREFTARDFDALLELLGRGGGDMQAAADNVLQWTDMVLNRALIELTEKQRWNAIVTAQVVRRGDNGYVETVTYPNPTGHRAVASGVWSNDAYDPMDDIFAMADLLTSKGYRVTRIVTSTKVMRILEGNQIVARRFAGVRVLSASDVFDRLNRDNINAGFERNGLPTPEVYDLTYRDQSGRFRFLPEDAMVLFSDTGRDETVEIADGVRYLPNTIGYTAIGRAPGESAPGRIINVQYGDDPPHLEGKARQTSLPVIAEPEALGAITGIG